MITAVSASTPPNPVRPGVGFPDEGMGRMNYLVVSSDAHNAAFGDRWVIAVEIDSRAIYEGTYREPIVDAGTAMLDQLVWVARSALEEQVAKLHPGRHVAVAEQIRELIGN
jgi:mRNA-degrading endonuclease toxin of MazEF toxin-antitoxin module